VGAGHWQGLAIHSQAAGPVDYRSQHFSLPPTDSTGRADNLRFRCGGDAHIRNRGEVYATATPAGEAAVAVHRGPYNRMNEAHDAVRKWMAANRREGGGCSWEIYGDPTPGPADTETTVVYLLK
jgi:effector-binding domain-containing protein